MVIPSLQLASRLHRTFCSACAILVLGGGVACGDEAGTLAENFTYSDWKTGDQPMDVKWRKIAGNAPTIVGSDATFTAPFVEFNNTILQRDLDASVPSDYLITLEVSFKGFERCLWFGLLTESGDAGYVAVWSSGLNNQFSSQGSVVIRAVESRPSTDEAAWNPAVFSRRLSEYVGSGHNPDQKQEAAISPPFARIKLQWIQSKKELRLFVDDALKCSMAADGLEGLRHIYVGGSPETLFKSLYLQTEKRSR